MFRLAVCRSGRKGGAGPTGSKRAPISLEIATFVLFVALACVHTWPLATAPGTWCRNDMGDPILNGWALAWVAHQIVTDPLHLFDANIFYPERYTLAYSEHMLPQAIMVAPVLWLGGSPVLAHNLALLAGLSLTGWAFCFVARRWTGSVAAGIVAGSAAAFNAHSLTRLAHLQAQHLEFLALALLALDRLLALPRARRALALAGWFSLQSLTSGYALVFSTVAVTSALVARTAEWVNWRVRAPVRHLVLAGAVTLVIMLPFLAPYWIVRQEVGLSRSLEEVGLYSARITDYLATGGLLHSTVWSSRFFRGDALFPGFVVLLLAGVSVWSRQTWTDRQARMCLVIAIVAFALSFGSRFPPYVWLFRVVPLFEGIRAAVRLGQLALVALGVMAAFGTAWLLARLPQPRARALAGLVIVVLTNAEAWRGPLSYTRFVGIPKIYRTLSGEKDAIVAYFPLYPADAPSQNTRYMLGSTLNWRPMINGYSGFMPMSYRRHVQALRDFPDKASVDYLRKVGVTHVGVNSRLLSAHRLATLASMPELQLFTSDGNFHVYTLR
jgi:hypothetical protein